MKYDRNKYMHLQKNINNLIEMGTSKNIIHNEKQVES